MAQGSLFVASPPLTFDPAPRTKGNRQCVRFFFEMLATSEPQQRLSFIFAKLWHRSSVEDESELLVLPRDRPPIC